MLLRSLVVKLPNQLTIRRRGFSKDMANLIYNLDRLHRPRPFTIPRVFLEPLPSPRRSLDDHLFDVLEEATRLMRPERMLREMENISRMASRNGFEDVPLKIKPHGQEVANGQATGDDTKFAVRMRASEFKPEEIVVKIRDGYLFVDAQKEQRDLENGTYNYNQINNKYLLPRNLDKDSVRCEMTKDGYLTIQAEIKPEPEDNARQIPITNQSESLSESKINEKDAKE